MILERLTNHTFWNWNFSVEIITSVKKLYQLAVIFTSVIYFIVILISYTRIGDDILISIIFLFYHTTSLFIYLAAKNRKQRDLYAAMFELLFLTILNCVILLFIPFIIKKKQTNDVLSIKDFILNEKNFDTTPYFNLKQIHYDDDI